MHRVCWESSQSPARCIQAKPRCTHQMRVGRQWLTAYCDMGRAASGQAAVCASGCGGEREWHLARESSVAEAPGEDRGDGRERSQPLHPSAAVAIAPASTLLIDRRCRREALHFEERCRSACMLATLAGFSGAQPVLCAVRGPSRSAWRARTGEHGRPGAALHAKLNVL